MGDVFREVVDDRRNMRRGEGFLGASKAFDNNLKGVGGMAPADERFACSVLEMIDLRRAKT